MASNDVDLTMKGEIGEEMKTHKGWRHAARLLAIVLAVSLLGMPVPGFAQQQQQHNSLVP